MDGRSGRFAEALEGKVGRIAKPRSLALGFGVAAFVDEVPEVFGIGEGFVFGGNLGAVEEVAEGAFVKDAVHDDFVVGDLEVEAPVVGAEAVEGFAVAVEFAEFVTIKVFEVVVGDLKVVENLELSEGVELGNLGGGDFVEDDLKHG